MFNVERLIDRLNTLGSAAPQSVLSAFCPDIMHELGITQLMLFDARPDHLRTRHFLDNNQGEKTHLEFDRSDQLERSWLMVGDNWIGADALVTYPADPLLTQVRFLALYRFPIADADGAIMGIVVCSLSRTIEDKLKPSFERAISLLATQYKSVLLHELIGDAIGLFENAAEFAKLGFWHRNADSLRVQWSDETFRIFGEEPNSFQPTIDAYYSYLHPDDLSRMKQAEMDSYADRRKLAIDHRIIRKDGAVRWVHLHGQVSWNADDTPHKFFGVVQDITDQKYRELSFEQASLTDYLTNLGNRRGFLFKLRDLIERPEEPQVPFSITYIDLDYFKEVNDVHGHEFGDKVLNQFGDRLLSVVSEQHYIARIGGDEFGILHPNDINIDSVLEEIMQVITIPFEIDSVLVRLSASMGTSNFPHDGTNSETLMARADDAMFIAKKAGRNKSLIFDKSMFHSAERRALVRQRIKELTKHGEGLAVVYQPIVQDESETPGHFEALVRWHDKTLGNVPPSEFIPIAEESGDMADLSRLIIEKVLDDIETYRNRLPRNFRFSINLSASELADNATSIHWLLSRIKAQPELAQHLTIEVTETALLAQSDTVKPLLENMKQTGVLIALDDFGTGFSSLTHCHTFPIDMIKIDRSFVSGLGEGTDTVFIDSIINFAKTLNLSTVAEGVEDESTLSLLRGKVDWLQGYYFARPASLDTFIKI